MPDQRQWFVLAGSGIDDSENHEHDRCPSDDERKKPCNTPDKRDHHYHKRACHCNNRGEKEHDSLIRMIARKLRIRRRQKWNQEKQSYIGQDCINFILLDIRGIAELRGIRELPDGSLEIGVLSTVQLLPLAGANGVGTLSLELSYLHSHVSSFANVQLANGTEPFKGGLPI